METSPDAGAPCPCSLPAVVHLTPVTLPDCICSLIYEKWRWSGPFACTSLIPVRFTFFYLKLISHLNSLKSGDSFAER